MIDLSDGVGRDLPRLCAASGVGARLELEAVPIAPALIDGEDALGVDPLDLALHGGDDYELLATMAPTSVGDAARELHAAFGVPLTEIGTIVEGAGVVAISAEGAEEPLAPGGWDHFDG
jgi:thiamine-monophosphate kinase